MPEQEPFTADTLVASVLGTDTGSPQTTTEPPQTTEPEPEEPAGAEAEELQTSGEEDDDGADDSPKDEYDKIEDVSLLRERLRSKDKGYAQKEPYIKLGEGFAKVMEDPNALKAFLEDVEQTHSVKVSELLGQTPAQTTEFKLPSAPEGAAPEEIAFYDGMQEHFETVLQPYVSAVLAKEQGKVASLEKKVAELESKLAEPLGQYEASKQEAGFKEQVKAAAPEALRIFELREKSKATEQDLEAAMREFKPMLEAGKKPVDVLQLYMRSKSTTKEPVKDRPLATKETGTQRRAVDPHTNPDAVVAAIVGDMFGQYNKAP